MLRTLIIDDEPIALEKLKNYVEKSPALELAGVCESGFEAMQFMKEHEVDLLVTDINMPDLNGLEFIRSLKNPPLVIFTTAHPQYAIDGYKVSAVDYLLKPYGFMEFSQAANKAAEIFEALHAVPKAPAAPEDGCIFIKVDYKYVRVDLKDVRYIKGYGEYLQIFLESKDQPLVTLSSFSAMRRLLSDEFLQVHRSYIVNMRHVEQIVRGRLKLDEEILIPIGDSYKEEFQKYLQAHSIGKGVK